MLYKIIKGLVVITPSPALTYVLSATQGQSCILCVPLSQINYYLLSFIPTALNSLPSYKVEINS